MLMPSNKEGFSFGHLLKCLATVVSFFVEEHAPVDSSMVRCTMSHYVVSSPEWSQEAGAQLFIMFCNIGN